MAAAAANDEPKKQVRFLPLHHAPLPFTMNYNLTNLCAEEILSTILRALLVNSSTVVQFADIRLQNLSSSKICQFVICLDSKKQRQCLMNGKSEDFNREVVGMFVINHINRMEQELPI